MDRNHHHIVRTDQQPREKAGARQDKAFLMCACGSFLRPIVPGSAVVVCQTSGYTVGSVTWKKQAGEALETPVISVPQGLNQGSLPFD